MNLIIISIFIIGVLSVAYAIVYTLVNIHTIALWARIIATLLLLGGYVGGVALIMVLLGIPIS